ncbi:hypothetical protein C1M53_13785 [Mesorhizobium sp. Pch-S]|nr:hypothetical protein C1M53_13785 [Mesorhizobium sp. Pch-S]
MHRPCKRWPKTLPDRQEAQFQEKCVAVFRPELRQKRVRAFPRFRERRKRSRDRRTGLSRSRP